ncbi:MAG: polyamine aminopropyltransferase [Candidatus Mariimomonas ferrooxydans]
MIKFFEKDPYALIEYAYEIDNVLYNNKSKYQDIKILENSYFGKMLILDGVVQLTERDEFFYHEMLTHVVMHAHPNPRKVAVIGGGDVGTVRAVLKHKSVEKVYFIEIDEEVIKVSKKFLPTLSCDIDNPRVDIRHIDGAKFLKTYDGEIDVVIVDSTDIIGFATSLFTKEFFAAVKKKLTENGFYVTLSESLHFHKDIVIEVQESIKSVFPVVDLYTVPIATYPGNWWTFSVASKGLSPREMRSKFKIKTKYYSEEIHQNAFLPRGLYEKLMQKKLEW